MKDFLLENKEWLFSGIGIFLIALFIAIIKAIRNRVRESKNNKAQTLESMLETTHVTVTPPSSIFSPKSLTPKRIYDTIEEAPLLQQLDIAKYYYGIKVSWKGRLISAEKDNDYIKMLLMDDESGIGIAFELNPDNYQGIGLLKYGDMITVEGAFEKFELTHIRLSDARITF